MADDSPAAPAGSGEEWDDAAKAVARLAEGPDAGWGIWRDWLRSHLTGPGPGNLNLSCPGLDRERAAREAAEREREAEKQSHRETIARATFDQLAADDLRAALAASTEREAGLARLCREVIASLAEWDESYHHGTVEVRTAAEYRDALASLAAPEGGTSRPTPPEGT